MTAGRGEPEVDPTPVPDSLDRVSTASEPPPTGWQPPPRGTSALVVENDPTAGIRRLGDWLTGAGLDLVSCRPHAGEPLPATLDGYAAVVVLGGEQSAGAGSASAGTGAPWFGDLESLLRTAVRHRIPTLGVCLGAHLLATATGGVVGRSPSGPEFGARLVARRDAAADDQLFAAVPFAPDVIQWHRDEIVELPARAVPLAASTRYPYQAFRLGPAAWGVQFHIECDLETVAGWAMVSVRELVELGLDAVALLEKVERILPDIEAVWHPVAERFAAVALGAGPQPVGQPSLPIVNGVNEPTRGQNHQ
jgi:GMP synthase-like glutamine amidotransferase